MNHAKPTNCHIASVDISQFRTISILRVCGLRTHSTRSEIKSERERDARQKLREKKCKKIKLDHMSDIQFGLITIVKDRKKLTKEKKKTIESTDRTVVFGLTIA